MSRAFLVLAIAMVTGIRGAGFGQASRALLLNPDDPEWTNAAPARSTVVFETSKGRIVFEMRREWAPHGVDRFYTQAQLHRAGDKSVRGDCATALDWR